MFENYFVRLKVFKQSLFARDVVVNSYNFAFSFILLFLFLKRWEEQQLWRRKNCIICLPSE
jgi:hypothetical protein